MELHGVISGQGNHQAFLLELQQRVFGIFQEQAVVTEGRHGNGDLSQEVQILEHRTLEQGHAKTRQFCQMNRHLEPIPGGLFSPTSYASFQNLYFVLERED